MQGGRRAMPDLDAMASQIQHEAEMNDTLEMGSYLQKTLADREQADREFAAQGGWMGLGRRRKGGSGGSTSFTRKRKYKLPDEDEDDEEKKHLEENMWKYYWLITPSGHFKQRWDPFIQLLVVYNSTFIPLSLAFAYRLETTHTVIDYAVDLLFVVDMVVSCSTVYYNRHFELVMDRRKIIRHYLATWFVVDLLSILPLEVFAYVTPGVSADQQQLVADFLKLPRMLRLARFRKRVASSSGQGANLLRMVELCVLFIFIAHIVACIWWAIGRMGLPDTVAFHDDYSRSWILRMEERDSAVLIVPGAPNDQGRIPVQYLTALYWALTALLKTPSIGPDTPLEKGFTFFVTIFGVLVFTIFVGNTIEVLQAVSHSDEKRRRQLYTLSNFTRQHRLSRGLKSKIFTHFAAEYRATLGIDTSALLHQFPRALRGQVLVYMHRQTLRTCELFSVLTTECTKALLMCIVPSVCLQKEVLLGQGELCEYIYIMMRGALQVRDAPASDFELKPARSDASSGAIAFAAARLVRGACRAVLRAA